MDLIREVIAYKYYFEDFLKSQPVKIQNKIYKILNIIETIQNVPSKYLKHLSGTDGLYEARISLGNNIWRIFCFFDGNKLVILLNGFQKKTRKTPKREIEKALRMDDINIQSQHDVSFLISETPGKVAAHFNKIAKLDKIDKGLFRIQHGERDSKTGKFY